MRTVLNVCILAVLITMFANAPSADQWDLIHECGTIDYNENEDCYLFLGFESGPYAIYDGDPFSSGDTAFIYGEVDSTDARECPGAAEYLWRYADGLCNVIDFGCGRVSRCGVEDECGCVMTDEYGGLALLNYNGLSYGDSVRIYGRKLSGPLSWCGFSWYVWVDTLFYCGVTPTKMESWGHIKSLYPEN
ncbi:MAG: hypothetical protein KJ970_15155 [Candidatus Eisenbacteria bacterium]|uniref:Uncharacterized protein n=1 Tax=Eiseniibacteriota bacterium TaxID=2212470 RepID=A0A948W764_UNCEI|nr:hypothetical protein [Candidatus Eisenbacteria bacterium]MBU1948366.1 hypothetical protein [Candidatus Eisenbacteria bacterium]MBU2692259.1 hypothetical protein [Candidatus Eisenbacteria bacterium]